MNVLQLRCYRAAVVLAVCGTFFGAEAGERIIFSHSEKDVLAPAAPQNPRLPSATERHTSFAPAPLQTVAPYTPPSPRPEQRRNEKRSLFDAPELFLDKTTRDSSVTGMQRNSISPHAPRPFFVPSLDAGTDPNRALSPIQQYDWNPESSETNTREKPADHRGRFESSMFSRSHENEDSRSAPNESLTDFFENAKKIELSRKQLESNAEFEKLLRPTPPMMIGRSPDEPAGPTPLNATRTPTPVVPPLETSNPRSSLDPMQAFTDQQRHWRGPSMEDMNRKVFGSTAAKPSLSAENPDQRAPLMRQPTFQEFPARRF